MAKSCWPAIVALLSSFVLAVQSAAYPTIPPPDLSYPRPDRSMATLLASNGLHRLVDARTPPTFMVVGFDDSRAPYDNCLAYATALHEKGVRFELHILGRGEHGAPIRDERSAWTPLAFDWLQARGIAPAPRPQEKMP